MRRFAIGLVAALAPLCAHAQMSPGPDPDNAPLRAWPVVAPGPVPADARAIGYTCSSATAVILVDAGGNQITTTLPGGSFHSFFPEVPASFSVTGVNSCVFSAEH